MHDSAVARQHTTNDIKATGGEPYASDGLCHNSVVVFRLGCSDVAVHKHTALFLIAAPLIYCRSAPPPPPPALLIPAAAPTRTLGVGHAQACQVVRLGRGLDPGRTSQDVCIVLLQ
jgi:hypothetical protein